MTARLYHARGVPWCEGFRWRWLWLWVSAVAAGCGGEGGADLGGDLAGDLAVDLARGADFGFPLPAQQIISSDPGSRAEADAVLVRAPGGVLLAAWMSLRERGYIAAARSDDGGLAWMGLGPIALPAGAQAVDPSLAVDSMGTVHLGYQSETAGVRSIWQVPLSLGATPGGFGVAVEVSAPEPLRRDAPWLTTLDDGTLVAVYSERHPGDPGTGDRLVLARSVDQGASWTRADIPGSDGEVPIALADGRGGLFVASSDPMRRVRHHYSPDGGLSFAAATPSLGQIAQETRPRLAVVDGRVVMVFARAERGTVACLRFDAGVLVDDRDLFAEEGALSILHPVIAARAPGRLTLAFYATYDGIRGRWRASYSDDAGDTFAPSSPVSDADLRYTPDRGWTDWLGDYEDLLVDGDGVLTAWTDNRDPDSHVYFARGLP